MRFRLNHLVVRQGSFRLEKNKNISEVKKFCQFCYVAFVRAIKTRTTGHEKYNETVFARRLAGFSKQNLTTALFKRDFKVLLLEWHHLVVGDLWFCFYFLVLSIQF